MLCLCALVGCPKAVMCLRDGMRKPATKALDAHHKIVITSAEQPEWRVFDYGPEGSSAIQKWYDNELSLGAQTIFDAMLKALRYVPDPALWVGNRGHLKGKPAAEGVFELGFRADKRQYRVFCVTRPRRELVLLLGCYHKQDDYKPTEALATGTLRAKKVREGKAVVCERKIDTSI